MAKKWESRIEKTKEIVVRGQRRILKLSTSSHAIINRITQTMKTMGYWSGVGVAGIAISILILEVSGVPVLRAADASLWQSINTYVGAFIYYVFIFPISIFALLIVYLLEIVMTYPFGTFWQGETQSGGFVNVTAVQTGWKVVRDICNMFFALILVIIALATVLKIEAFSWKQMLPKFVLHAVLINFSKSIAGVFTDMATVAMATFSGSFAGSFGSAMLSGFNISSSSLLGFDTPPDGSEVKVSEGSSGGTILLAYIAAAGMVFIFTIVSLVFLVTLIFRIIMLWFLIILSPMAYITRILPQTQKHSSQWWEMFGRYVLVGPLISFFLWLSLTIAFGQTSPNDVAPLSASYLTGLTDESELANKGIPASPTTGAPYKATTPNALAGFMVSILLLMASLKKINEMAAEGGTYIGAVQNTAFGAAGRLFEKGGDIMTSALGKVQFGPARGEEDKRGRIGKALGGMGNFLANTGTVLGSSVFQPLTFAKGVAASIKASSDESKRRTRGIAMTRMQDMRDKDILGRGVLGAVAGVLNNAGGIVAGAGMEDGKHVFDKYISGAGAMRIIKRMKAHMQKEDGMGLLDAVEKKADAASEKAANASKQLTQEEFNREAARYNLLVGGVDGQKAALAGLQAALASGNGAQMVDLGQEDLKGAVQEQIDELEKRAQAAYMTGDGAAARDYEAAANQLKGVLGTQTTLGTLQAAMASTNIDSGVRDKLGKRLTDAKDTQIKSLESEMKNIKERFDVSGINTGMYDATGMVATTAAGSFITDEDRQAIIMDAKKAGLRKQKVFAEFGGLEAGISYEGRKYKQGLVAEEMQKLQDVQNTDELMVYLGNAIQDKNQDLAEALVKRITQNGDENELFQALLSGFIEDKDGDLKAIIDEAGKIDKKDIDGNVVKDPATGAVIQEDALQANTGHGGVELFRRAILKKKLGMTDSESMRVMNDVGFIGEMGRHNGVGRNYTSRAGRWSVNSLDAQQATLRAENRKKDFNGFVIKGNRLYWGNESGAGRDFELSASGLDELRSRGESLQSDRIWERWDANSKLTLSQPRIVAEMRRKGVSPLLCAKLEKYWNTTGKYVDIGNGIADRSGGISALVA